jgi:hypothetical protein
MKGICLVFLALCTSSYGQLQWDHQELEFHPSVQESNTVARFTFKNTGTNTITIASIQASCGCTTATTEKTSYTPGEKGDIVATFTFEGRIGLQEKTLLIQTDELNNSLHLLKLKVFIPELLKLTPSLVFWRSGDDPSEKIVSVVVNHNKPIRILKVVSDTPQFVANFEVLKEGQEYRISIKPTDTKTSATGSILIETDFHFETPHRFQIFTAVK